jgi:hypothetical protein
MPATNRHNIKSVVEACYCTSAWAVLQRLQPANSESAETYGWYVINLQRQLPKDPTPTCLAHLQHSNMKVYDETPLICCNRNFGKVV